MTGGRDPANDGWELGGSKLPKLPGPLGDIYYADSFISEEEETQLMHCAVHEKVPPWTTLSGRRLRVYGGVVGKRGLVADPRGLPSWMQVLLDRIHDGTRAFQDGDGADDPAPTTGAPTTVPPCSPPNHVLLNEYLPGQGIMPHEDGPAYHPVVVIVSLGANAILRFYKTRDASTAGAGQGPPSTTDLPVMSVFLRPRSVIVFKGDAYTRHMHGIDAAESETVDATVANCAQAQVQLGDKVPRGGTRLSLTVRRVNRIIKGLSNLLKGSTRGPGSLH
ncbi:unnamed protein product [Pedinophyceae sp. YPF-701]|nr:unnamed protein product [Pedinophyceae sp. YPF-701]